MNTKAIGILAGPRKGQITDHMLDAALNGLKDAGIETQKLYLYDMDIKPCRGCLACRETHECIIKDDHRKVLDLMSESDIVVFASPTYVGNITSVAKAFIDRSISRFKMTNFGPRWQLEKPKKVILLTSCMAPFPFSHILGCASGCLRAMKVFFGMITPRIKTLSCTGITNYEPKKCEGVLNKAYRLGKTFNMILACTALICLYQPPAWADKAAIGSPAPFFKVQSGDDKEISLDDLKDRVAIIFYESKNAIEENRALKNELNKLYDEQSTGKKAITARIAVVDCAGIIFTKVWKDELKAASAKEGITVYGDWDGKMSVSYGMEKGSSNMIVIDRKGLIRYFGFGAVKESEISKIIQLINSLLRE